MANKVSIPNKIFGTVLAHSMRGRMLSRTELQTLAESRDIEELVTRMKNTIYLDVLTASPSWRACSQGARAARLPPFPR